MTSIPRAGALAAAALAVLPGLTAAGIDEDGTPLADSRVLREVAAAADWLAGAAPAPAFLPRSSTSILSELAAERAGLVEVGSGSMLAAAIGLGIPWQPIGKGPHALLAVRPGPSWTQPTSEAVVQATRRLGGFGPEDVVSELVAASCAGRGRQPPPRFVARAVALALQQGLVVRSSDGQLVA